MARRLGHRFFLQDTVEVARSLLGKYLVRRVDHVLIVGRITETEAYCGPHDKACHASKGRTARTEVMFGPAGHWYVYLIYGMYHCLNIVTEEEGYPAAVLIRGVQPLRGVPEGTKTDGPGKLCRAFHIDRLLNTHSACTPDAALWLEDHGEAVLPDQVLVTPRIGVDYAGEYKDKPWRFVLQPLNRDS